MAKLREMSALGADQTKIARELGISRRCVQYQQKKPDNAQAIAEIRKKKCTVIEDTIFGVLSFLLQEKPFSK